MLCSGLVSTLTPVSGVAVSSLTVGGSRQYGTLKQRGNNTTTKAEAEESENIDERYLEPTWSQPGAHDYLPCPYSSLYPPSLIVTRGYYDTKRNHATAE